MKCPKCHADNTDTSRFCSNCATQLTREGQLSPSLTMTFVSPAHALTKGSLVAGKYRIVEEIGRGGMGVVYCAHDESLDRDVAIKVLPPEFATDSERLRRFEQEAKAAGQLNHPNILVVYEIGTHEGAPCIVTELLEGESLRERLMSGALPIRKAVETTVQIARGLSAAHEKGIIHRDLKPDNVFLTKDGHVKILDFGLAKLARSPDEISSAATLSDATQAGTVLGTVGYMSPEQVLGKPLDARSDLFSLGVVLYEMLSGIRPFQKGSAPETMTAILKEEPPELVAPGRSVSPGLDSIVRHCLDKEPSGRFQSARDIAFALETLSQSTTSRAATLPARRSKRRLAIGALGLALLAGSFSGFFLLTRHATKMPVASYKRLTFRRGWVNAARFAPDGHTVVYSAAWEGGLSEVFSLRLDSPESRSLGHSSAELLAISPTSELALDLNTRIRKSVFWWAGTLAQVPFSGGTPRPLDERITFADWAPDGKELALVRETDTVDQLEYPAGNVLCTSGGAISYPRVSPTGNAVAFIDSPFSSMEGAVAVVDRTGKKTTLTESFRGGAQGLAWSPKGDEIWFTAAEVGRLQELRAVTLKSRQRLLLREPFSIRLLDVAKDGRVLVAYIQSPARCFFRGEKDAVDRELSWLDSSKIQDLTRDGRFVVMTEDGDGAGASAQTYIRETTGALPMKVGSGYGSFSPDERFVVATLNNPSGIALYPVGPGQPRTVHVEGVGLEDVWGLLPDARTLVFTGNEPSRAIRIWITDLAGSKPRPITPEGVNVVRPLPVTPDGKFVLGVTGQRVGGRILAYPVAGGEPQPFIGLLEGELIARWGLDGQWFFAYRPDVIPIRIFRVNSKTGARTLVHEITPADRAGRIFGIWALTTPDGKAYAYTTQISRSELHLVEGLK